jgi:hypothetical protein
MERQRNAGPALPQVAAESAGLKTLPNFGFVLAKLSYGCGL